MVAPLLQILPGFKDCVPSFPPTFKVDPGVPTYSYQKGLNKKGKPKKPRVPSYCDRILWKSMPGRENDITLLAFEGFPQIVTSDHKPVHARFEVNCCKSVAVNKGPSHLYPQVAITNLRAEGLHPSDTNGLADPYVKFLSDPPALFASPKKPKMTEVIKKSLNPT